MTYYTSLTPKYDLHKKRPKKKLLAHKIRICKEFNFPVKKRMNPSFASEYHPNFLKAFCKICEIFQESDFKDPATQVLILMLENDIKPCRAVKFNKGIVQKLGHGIF